MTGGDEIIQGGTRKIFVEKKFHPAMSGFDGFHGRQFTGEFQAGADVGFLQRGIILQNLLVRLSCGDRADDAGNQNARAAHDGSAVADRRVKRDLI